jgi:hypothetical protein
MITPSIREATHDPEISLPESRPWQEYFRGFSSHPMKNGHGRKTICYKGENYKKCFRNRCFIKFILTYHCNSLLEKCKNPTTHTQNVQKNKKVQFLEIAPLNYPRYTPWYFPRYHILYEVLMLHTPQVMVSTCVHQEAFHNIESRPLSCVISVVTIVCVLLPYHSSWKCHQLAAEQLKPGQSMQAVQTIHHRTNHTCRVTLPKLS